VSSNNGCKQGRLGVVRVSPELEYIRREAQRTAGSASNEQLSRAKDGKWSSVQILEHLMLTYTATTKGLLRTMEAGRPEPVERTLGHRLRSFYVLGLGRFPGGMKAPRHTVPREGLGEEPLRRFNDALVAMDASLNDAERRFGQRTRVLQHPALGPLTSQQWRRFHKVHARHHLKQVAQRLNAGS
jgi:hypothetical protein